MLDIPEGESAAAVALKGGGGTKAWILPSRCDRFFIDFYENGYAKTYRSDLSLCEKRPRGEDVAGAGQSSGDLCRDTLLSGQLRSDSLRAIRSWWVMEGDKKSRT